MKKLAAPLVGVLLVSASLFAARRESGSKSTAAGAAAQTASHPSSRVAAEGRVVAYPGEEVVVGTDLAGTIGRLLVQEKSVVRKGDLIAEIAADEQRAALSEARARIAEADSDIRLAELEI